METFYVTCEVDFSAKRSFQVTTKLDKKRGQQPDEIRSYYISSRMPTRLIEMERNHISIIYMNF